LSSEFYNILDNKILVVAGYGSWSTIVPAAATGNAMPAQLITLILLTNCCYNTKVAKQKITFVHCTL